jgi:hypothetical protein
MPIFVTNDSNNLEGFLITENSPRSRTVKINSGLYIDSDRGDIVKFNGLVTPVINLPDKKQWVLLSVLFSTGELTITYGNDDDSILFIPDISTNSFILGLISLDSKKEAISDEDIYQVNVRNKNV